MKYRLRCYNRVQETDSEERKKELLSQGYQLVLKDGRPVTAAKDGRKDLESAHQALMEAYEALEKKCTGLEEENARLKQAAGQTPPEDKKAVKK